MAMDAAGGIDKVCANQIRFTVSAIERVPNGASHASIFLVAYPGN